MALESDPVFTGGASETRVNPRGSLARVRTTDDSAVSFAVDSGTPDQFQVRSDGTVVAPGGFVGPVTGPAATASALVTAVAPSLASGDGGVAGSSATVNKPAGTFTLDHTTGAVFTLTNSLIVAGVKVFGQLNTDDATGVGGIRSIVINTSAHTAVFTLQHAPAANVAFSFFLLAFA